MPGYKCKFRDKVLRQFVCPICRYPMRDPVQITNCGHHYCDTCLQEYLSAGVFECPEDRLPLDYAKIYPDDKMSGDIQMLMVRCQFYKDGCRWTDQLMTLQAHLESCQYNMVACKECSAMVARNHLKDHLQYDCPRRTETCEYCGSDFVGSKIDAHLGKCQLEVVFCENKCGAQLQRRFINHHMLNECAKRSIPCKYCHKDFVYETLQNHLHQCPRYPINCPNRCEPNKIPREDMEKHLSGSCPSALAPCPFKEHGCKHRGPRFGLERHLDESMKSHLSLMCSVVASQQKTIAFLEDQLETLSLNTDGQLLWRVTNYAERFTRAKSEEEVEIVSPPFFTGRYGYKLQVSIFPNGNGSGEGAHLSVYIRVTCGDYDSLLRWPFTFPISFTLLDQNEDPNKRMHIKESFTPDPTWKNFQRPSRDVHVLGYGYPTFVSHNFLKTRDYVKDDVLFLRVRVDCSSGSSSQKIKNDSSTSVSPT
ncbi:TNF receptor-associated factor 4-like [Diadema antillarum]|uniref:TNF receptor-associated factor 4-like n=1 Tax=Diadema antillarum TaxID=105358 RepID=UPI003A8A71B0